jgi:hypothetical protein
MTQLGCLPFVHPVHGHGTFVSLERAAMLPGSGLTYERVRTVVEALSGRRKPSAGAESIPFSREVRRTFEAATNVCASALTMAV